MEFIFIVAFMGFIGVIGFMEFSDVIGLEKGELKRPLLPELLVIPVAEGFAETILCKYACCDCCWKKERTSWFC
jgi:hypothetical protein